MTSFEAEPRMDNNVPAEALALVQEIRQNQSRLQEDATRRFWISMGAIGVSGIAGFLLGGLPGIGVAGSSAAVPTMLEHLRSKRLELDTDAQLGRLMALMQGHEEECAELLRQAGIKAESTGTGTLRVTYSE